MSTNTTHSMIMHVFRLVKDKKHIEAIKYFRENTEVAGRTCSLTGAKQIIDMMTGAKIDHSHEVSTEMLALLLTSLTGDGTIRANNPLVAVDRINDPELNAINDAIKALNRIPAHRREETIAYISGRLR